MAKKTKDSNLSIEERLEQALIPNWDEPYKLPDNWCWLKLLSAFENCTDSKKKIQQKDYLESGLWSVVDQGQSLVGGYTNDETMLYNGNLPVIIFGDHTRCVKYIDFNFAQGADGVKVLRPKSFYNPKFFFYALQNVDIPNLGYRRHFPLFDKFSIPLAPLEEQQRIVEHVESLFAKLDEAKEKAQEVVDGYESRKAAILHKAFSGELTKKWRKEKCMDFSKLDIPLIDICSKITDGFHNSPKPVEQGVPYIMAGDVQEDGINFNNGLYMDEKNHRELYNKAYPQKGDILMVNIGASTGRAALIDVDFEFSFKNCAILKLQKDKVNPKYVLYYLWSQKERLLKEVTQGGAQPFLSLKIIKNINIPVIEYIEQCEIVRILENLLLNEKTAAEAAEKVIEQIETMKKAILARAFRGELGTNDPSEESAVELLKEVLGGDVAVQTPAKKPTKRILIPSDIKELLSNIREEEIIKLLLKSAPQPVSIQAIMALSSKKFELMDALRSLEKKQLITKNESGEYSLTR